MIYNKLKLSLNDINDGHIALFRIGAGIVIFSFAMNSFAMPSFLFEKDKLRFIQSRLAVSTLFFKKKQKFFKQNY